MKACLYCGTEGDEKNCTGCGAPLVKDKVHERIERSEPFFYNGYIVWSLRDPARRMSEFYFYLGAQLVDTIMITDHLIASLNIDPFGGVMEFIFKLFELSQGTEEVLRIQQQNIACPSAFEIRRIEPVKLSIEEGVRAWQLAS